MTLSYKVLGQVTPAPAKPTEVINWIKNPSFEGRSLENWFLAANGPQYRAYTTYMHASERGQYTDDQPESYSKTWGSDWALRVTCDSNASWSLFTATDPHFTSYTRGMSCNKPDNLIPVKPRARYYCAFSLRIDSAAGGSNTFWFRVDEWDGDKRYVTTNDTIGRNESSSNYLSGVASKFSRHVGTSVLQPETQFVSVSIRSDGSSIPCYLDDIYFGERMDAAYAPFNPDAAPDLTYLPPFDKRRYGYLGERHRSYSGKSYAGPLSALYTVPAGKQALSSSMLITNVGDFPTYYRVAVLPSGVLQTNLTLDRFLVFDEVIRPQDTVEKIQGLTLNEGDKILVAADNGTTNFTLFGTEKS